MSSEDYRGKIEEAIAPQKEALKDQDVQAAFYIFFSFDLVNSTKYKTYSRELWPIVISRFYELIADGLSKRVTNLQLWKYVGDELLLYKKLNSIQDIHDCLPKAHHVLKDAINRLHQEFPDTRTILSIKGTVWCARASEVAPQDIEEIKKGEFKLDQKNIVVLQGGSGSQTQIDFLGPDIDLGFRIAKHALRRRLVVSADLAYLLYKERNVINIEDKLKILSYEVLKGIWGERRYPIIWYEDDWDKVSQSILYDERFESPLIEKVLDKKFSAVKGLEKVFDDLDQKKEIEEVWQFLKELSPQKDDKAFAGILPATLVELHCVAVCFDKEDKILIARRLPDKRRFPSKWEFGCGQLRVSETFQECLQRSYKEDFGAELSFGNRLQPITTYFIDEQDERRKIPGAIFLAFVNNPEQVKALRHSEIDWLNLNSIDSLSDDDCVPDLKDTIHRAIKVKQLST
jgi:ADP-ribose pyrophosphatase YjhB (NUDIX family)